VDAPFIDVGGIIVAAELLTIQRAKQTAAVIQRGVLDYAKLIECRRLTDGKAEAIILDVEVARPQLRAYDIRATERVAVVFNGDDRRPEVLSLRADFPQVPHLNLTHTDYPKSLCLYDQDWLEVKSSWTPVRCIERIRYWFAETVKASLHQEDQPLEPLIVSSGYKIVVPHDLFASIAADDLQRLKVALVGGERGTVMVATRHSAPFAQGMDFIAVAVKAEPQTHGVIRNAPATLHALHQFLSSAGLDLLATLRSKQQFWADNASLKARLIIIAVCPKKRGDSASVEATDVWTFLTFRTVAEVLAAIGRRAAGGGILLGEAGDGEQGQAIPLEVLRTYFSLSRSTAAYLNGYAEASDLNTVAIGSGALGSKVQLNLARSGFGRWTLVDDDILLPHNLARHQSLGHWVGLAKTDGARDATESLFENEPAPVSIVADVQNSGAEDEAIAKAFENADLILDMSASVAAARYVALARKSTARRMSVFLNPAGTDLVVLAEDAKRKITLDALEFQLYRAILSDERLRQHLIKSTGRVRYAASCRDITSRVPDDQVSLLASVATRAVRQAVDNAAAQIRIWQLDPKSFTVTSFSVPASRVHTKSYSDWTLFFDDGLVKKLRSLRKAKLPNETGGVLLGYFEHSYRRAYVVDTIPSPPDSKEWPTLYIRGSATLDEEMERVKTVTAGNLEYVGEWHSHPAGYGCQPSHDDFNVFSWLTRHMDDEGQPALMAIVGDEGPSFFLGQMIWDEK